MELRDSDKNTIWYIIGKIDGIIEAGCSFENVEIRELLTSIRNQLSDIVTDSKRKEDYR